MFIPMILTPLLSFVLSYAVTSFGLVPVLNGMQLQTGTPVLLSGFLTGGWQAAVDVYKRQAFVLAVLAGAFVALGASFMLMVRSDASLAPSISLILGGLAF